MFKALKNMFSPSRPSKRNLRELDGGGERRWESGKTDRLNKAHWAAANGADINSDLNQFQETLRNRSIYEAANNPLVKGVIETHTNDLIGRDGPPLQVQSAENPEYGKQLEKFWKVFWKDPDISGMHSMPEKMRLWVHALWNTGDFLDQIVDDPNARGPIKMKLKGIHSRRLASPFNAALSDNIILGIARDKNGRPTKYYFQKEQFFGSSMLPTLEYEEVPARNVIHGFRAEEPDQVRGVPWMAPVLQPTADLRDFSTQVMDAARQAADGGIIYYTEHEDAEYIEFDGTIPIKRRQAQTAPPTWKPFQLKPEQPSTGYVEFYHERAREIGRPINMPLMMVLLDSGDHNYSSARFDGQIYLRGLQVIQGWLERVALNRLVDMIATEARLAGKLPAAPSDVNYSWTWPVPPHVDPKKEADAEKTRLQNLTMTLTKALAAQGIDIEAHFAELKRERELAKEAGIDLEGLLKAPAPKSEPEEPRKDKPEVKPASGGNRTNGVNHVFN